VGFNVLCNDVLSSEEDRGMTRKLICVPTFVLTEFHKIIFLISILFLPKFSSGTEFPDTYHSGCTGEDLFVVRILVSDLKCIYIY
jgi:hypothetical protein